MINTNTTIYRQKRPGHLPGIDVGDDFYSHAEMYVLGLHWQPSGGIDYMGAEYKKMEKYKNLNYKFPMAVSIVLSGQYEDDEDNSDVITYTVQGGNNSRGDKLQIADQEMKRGNLALKELCYDYGYTKDSVEDENGNFKHMRCCCGARDCREFMF
ncbi:hypothetical protein MKW98_012813 [Papaver atlanticum]|uniref:Post-SET domain-containing protein n=1 Tax=Papaver atlanticum TaxID=357466 RepID=A0AAD4SN08_9MAGN|nr:hypothetical protein MKW98_012813 [Papaver atlanticum]